MSVKIENIITTDSFIECLKRNIEKSIEQIVEEIAHAYAHKAFIEVKAEVANRVGQYAIEILNSYTVFRDGPNLNIIVKIQDSETERLCL